MSGSQRKLYIPHNLHDSWFVYIHSAFAAMRELDGAPDIRCIHIEEDDLGHIYAVVGQRDSVDYWTDWILLQIAVVSPLLPREILCGTCKKR